jgi:SAM-dependent methyltransferase
MNSQYPINSRQYWDNRFSSGSWDEWHGQQQTQFFMQLLISYLPLEVFKDIYQNALSLIDFGCAKGQGCLELYKSFPSSEITGLDFSSEAIHQARLLYPTLNFRTTPLSPDKDKYDVVYCSNVLEHLSDWTDYIKLFTEVAQKYIIILVPYKNLIFDEHVVSFDDDSFPTEISGFKTIDTKIIDTWNSNFWNGSQLLKIYQKV